MTEWGDNIEVFIPKNPESAREGDPLFLEHTSSVMKVAGILRDHMKKLQLADEEEGILLGMVPVLSGIILREGFVKGFFECMDAARTGNLDDYGIKIIQVGSLYPERS
jgi:hypothetical protein